MNNDKLEKIKQIVKEKDTEEDFNYHIVPVVKNSFLLADKLKVDNEVVEVAAWLHDIGRIVNNTTFEKENEHHTEGEKEAVKVLSELGYEKEFIEKVAHCVLTHRGREGAKPKTVEAKIVASADAMSHLDTFLDMIVSFSKEIDSFEELINVIERKIKIDWDEKMIPEAREIVKNKYDAIMLLIKSMKGYI
ncbi:MAG: HD domain-containing protein [archaeon]